MLNHATLRTTTIELTSLELQVILTSVLFAHAQTPPPLPLAEVIRAYVTCIETEQLLRPGDMQALAEKLHEATNRVTSQEATPE
jgi:hypothetical protein